MNEFLKSLITKALTAPVQFLLTALTAWIVTGHIGPTNYSAALLLIGLPLLLPFLDLGTSAPLITGFARLQFGMGEEVRKSRANLLAYGLRRSALSSCFLIAVGFVMLFTQSGQVLLGNSFEVFSDTKLLFFLFAIFLAVSTVFGPSQKALIGFGKNHVTMFVNLITAFLTFILCSIASQFTADPIIYALIPSFCSATVMFFSFFVSLRLLGVSLNQILSAIREPSSSGFESAPQNANFMLLITLFLALINYSDKYLISGLLPLSQLPGYVYLSQIYIPGWAAITGVLIFIWPYITKWEVEHGATSARSKFIGVWGLTCLFGVLAAALFYFAAPDVIKIISHGGVEVDLTITAAFALLLLVQFAQFPLGVYLVGNSGLRFQAIWLAIGAITYVPLTLTFLQFFGALGAVLSTITVTLLFQLVPNFIYFKRMVLSNRNENSDLGL